MNATIFRPGPTLGLTRFYPAPRTAPFLGSRPAPRPAPRRMAQAGLCCQAQPGNRVICSNGYSFSRD